MSRCTKFSPEITGKILQAFRMGCYIQDAAAAVGIPVTTVRGWIKRGQEAKSGAYAEFAVDVEIAQGLARVSAIKTIQKEALVDWKAAAWFLEHGPARHQWRKQISVDLTKLTDAEIAAALSGISQRIDSGGEAEGDSAPE
jgi:hypothetical protein